MHTCAPKTEPCPCCPTDSSYSAMRVSVAFIVLVFLLAACTGGKRYVVGVSQCSVDNWREKFNNELRASAYLYDNVTLDIVSAMDDDRQQVEQINKLVDKGVDLLIVSPNQVNSIMEALRHASDKGIPVIFFDRKAALYEYAAFIGADNRMVGREMGKHLAQRMNGHGKVIEISGLRGSSPAIERHEGFMEAMKAYPGMEVVGQAYGDWLRETARQRVDSLLAQGLEFDCVFAQNDRMALGARDAVGQSAMRADSITYVGVDALPSADGGLACVRDGVLEASYIYPTRGDLVMQLAMNILEHKPYQRDNDLAGTLVTADNVEALLLQSDELTKLQSRLDVLHDKIDLYMSQYSHQKVYGVLMLVIIVLLIGSFAVVYRSIVTKRKILEQTTDAKLRFFTNVSHEFRTPITLLADPVERLLADHDTTDSQRQLLLIMRRNVGVLLRLVGDILDFRKVQNGKMDVEVTRFDICAAIHDWVSTFTPLAERKQVDINLNLPPRLDVTSDALKLERICYNLLSNAMKYTASGGHISIMVYTDSEEQFSIIVADTGMGIPSSELSKVFERFYQVKGTPSETGGTGIGLALVKAFVQLLGGSISVESAEGKGTTFTVVLPLESKGEMATASGSAPSMVKEGLDFVSEATEPINSLGKRATSPDTPIDRPVVLIVDDNDDVLSYLCTLLGDAYEVRTANNGQVGYDLAMKEVPDAIVSDVMMPVMDGLEMCRRLKAETATCHIPIIMLTARSLEEQRAEGYDCGADAYLTKPFSGNVLVARVRNLLESRRQLRQLFANGDVQQETRPQNADTRFIDSFRRIVQERMSDADLSVETLGAEMGLSRVQLYRKIKALTGQTPVELIRTARLRRAEQLLAYGDKTVAEIAYEVGFSSPSYFTKCYKDFFGHTPNEKR